MIIRDMNGQERSWAWLESIYGTNVRQQQDPNSTVQVIEIWAMCDPGAGIPLSQVEREALPPPTKPPFGPDFLKNLEGYDPGAVIVAQVRDEDGQPIEGYPVARWWPDESLPHLKNGLDTWKPKGVHGDTNQNGDIGFGMGHGDFYDPASGEGASWVWPLNGNAVSGIGMVAGTSHWTIWPVFQIGGVVPPSPPPPPVDPIMEQVTVIRHAADLIEAALVC